MKIIRDKKGGGIMQLNDKLIIANDIIAKAKNWSSFKIGKSVTVR